MKQVLIVFTCVLMLMTGCTRAPAPQSTVNQETVINNFLQALSRGDVEACLSLLADDVVFRQEPSGMRVDGKAQLEAAIRKLATWNHHYSVIGSTKTEWTAPL